MIHRAIAHVLSELNDYFSLRSGETGRAMAGSLFDQDGKINDKAKEKVVVTLVNVEEERTYRSVEVVEKRRDGTGERVQPPVKVNLYLLFVANLKDYPEALKALSQLMSFFQHRPALEFSAIPSLADREGRMTFELHSQSFEQVNHLWGALGGKYLPSVLYKAGIFEIRDRQLEAEVPPVEEMVVVT